jgi:hypothetical protein
MKATGNFAGGIVGYSSDMTIFNVWHCNVNIDGKGCGVGGILGLSFSSFVLTNFINLNAIISGFAPTGKI